MKTRILLILFTLASWSLTAQTNPDIEGDTMLCPDTEGTAYVTNPVFDTYQWYYKYWFVADEFVPIEGANEPTFTYDWFTYDQALLKVIATLGDESYESDTLQIDSYAWTPIFVMYELGNGVSFDPETETFLLDEGAVFPVQFNNPPYDTLIQWYRNDVPIEGANTEYYEIKEEGTYYASAAPSFCPNSSANTMPLVVTMVVDVPMKTHGLLTVFPNPASEVLFIESALQGVFEKYTILDTKGRVILQSDVISDRIAVSRLLKGHYILKLEGKNQTAIRQFIKQ